VGLLPSGWWLSGGAQRCRFEGTSPAVGLTDTAPFVFFFLRRVGGSTRHARTACAAGGGGAKKEDAAGGGGEELAAAAAMSSFRAQMARQWEKEEQAKIDRILEEARTGAVCGAADASTARERDTRHSVG
jgi:hypothetical protein